MTVSCQLICCRPAETSCNCSSAYSSGMHHTFLLLEAQACGTTVNSYLFSGAPMYLCCRLNAENESGARENAGKLLTHIGRSRISPLTSLLPSPQHLQPMLEKAFAAQRGTQLKQVCRHNSQRTYSLLHLETNMSVALPSGLRCVVPERDAALLLFLSQPLQLMTWAKLAVVMNKRHKRHVASRHTTSPLAQQSDTPSFALNMTVAELDKAHVGSCDLWQTGTSPA